GKLRALATWGESRVAALPDVPTLKELGYDLEYYLWAGLFAPKNLTAGVFKTLRAAARQAVGDADFRAAMARVEMPIAYQDADEFKAWWRSEERRVGKEGRVGGGAVEEKRKEEDRGE